MQINKKKRQETTKTASFHRAGTQKDKKIDNQQYAINLYLFFINNRREA
jgi:hypothetical protein